MAKLPVYEKVILALTAGFVLFTGGWFISRDRAGTPYQVTTAQRRSESASVQTEQRESGRPDSLLEGETINLNTADVYDLQRLPGIGEKRAQDIAAYREEHGPFQTVDDLLQVSGIGEGILDGLRDYASTGD